MTLPALRIVEAILVVSSVTDTSAHSHLLVYMERTDIVRKSLKGVSDD